MVYGRSFVRWIVRIYITSFMLLCNQVESKHLKNKQNFDRFKKKERRKKRMKYDDTKTNKAKIFLSLCRSSCARCGFLIQISLAYINRERTPTFYYFQFLFFSCDPKLLNWIIIFLFFSCVISGIWIQFNSRSFFLK